MKKPKPAHQQDLSAFASCPCPKHAICTCTCDHDEHEKYVEKIKRMVETDDEPKEEDLEKELDNIFKIIPPNTHPNNSFYPRHYSRREQRALIKELLLKSEKIGEERIKKQIGEAFYISKSFDLEDAESIKGKVVLAWDNGEAVIKAWCQANAAAEGINLNKEK